MRVWVREGFEGNLIGNANTATSASYAANSTNAISASFAILSQTSVSASYAITASYIDGGFY